MMQHDHIPLCTVDKSSDHIQGIASVCLSTQRQVPVIQRKLEKLINLR